MFNLEELQAISALLQRVDIKGAEAMTVVALQQKIGRIAADLRKPKTPEDKSAKEKKPDPS